MDHPAGLPPLLGSFERHLRATNRADTTVATYLIAARQAETFLRARGTELPQASRADLEAYMGDLLARRSPSTAATYHKVLKILYGWLAEEGEIPTNPILSADSSPASVNILVPREDLNLQPPDSHTGALSLSYKGKVVLVETAGSNPRRRRGQRRALPAALRPRGAGVVPRPGAEPAHPVVTVLQTAPLADGVPRYCRSPG